MTFPVELPIFGGSVPVHPIFETLGYIAGFQTYLLLRRRSKFARVGDKPTVWIIVGCIVGALLGSKLLAIAESFPDYWRARHQLVTWLGGKTIVGGLLGGWVGVEIAKWRLHVHTRTGDLFVFPLILGIAIGRVGCFLTGLPDRTHGVHSSLPWAINFGDGPRHPTQLYEIASLALIAVALIIRSRRAVRAGDLFRWVMLSYLTFRFAVEFIKPVYTLPIVHLSAIQIATAVGAIVCAAQLLMGKEAWRVERTRNAAANPTVAG
jgi:prolipoprotein diacylglyceryltransferase